jgi:catechol 2,3-dioxygenase-like lactoylglutathione lyase family enzyme
MAARSRSRKPTRAARKPTRAARKPTRTARKPRTSGPRRTAAPAAKAAAAKAPNGRAAGTGIGLLFHHMDYTTHDAEAMKRFYSETLGFTNVEHDPKSNYLMVYVTPTSGIGFMPPMDSAPDQWRPPGEPAFYFFVNDVDRVHRELSDRGVLFDQPPTDMPWNHRVARLRDPEGRTVCFAQELAR